MARPSRIGISVMGSPGPRGERAQADEPRRVPVNLLELDGAAYLVAPRGHTQWVRNLRSFGG